MPITKYIVDVKKIHQVTRESWGNRYLIQAASLFAATSSIDIIGEAESAIHFNNILIDSARVATLAAGDGIYTSQPLDLLGGGIVTGLQMPLFCTYQPRFSTGGAGPPGRKHYHTGFDTASYDADFSYDDVIVNGWNTALTTMLAALLANETPMINPQGATYTDVSGGGQVTFHQFTKASKRAPA